jgi:hypothetical protein
MTPEEKVRAIWIFSGIYTAIALIIAMNFYFDRYFRPPSKPDDMERPE